MIHLRAHNASRVEKCSGSLQLQYAGRAEKVDNPAMKFGREMHSLVDETLTDKIKLEEVEDDDHRLWLSRCLNFITTTIVGTSLGQGPWKDGKVESEVPLFVLGQRGEHIASCRADAVCWRDEQTLIIPDWKFYRQPLDPEEHKYQLLVMCVAALQHFPEAKVAQGILYLPVVDMVYNLDVTRDQLPEKETELYRIWEDANMKHPPLRSGKWCARCPCLPRCPTALSAISKIEEECNLAEYTGDVKLPTLEAMTKGILKRIHGMSPARVRRLVELYPLLAPLQDAIRDKLRADLERDATSHAAWELKERKTPARGDPQTLRTVAGDFNFAEEFEAECLTVKVSKVRALLGKVFRERAPDATKKHITELVEKELASHLTNGTTTALQRRKG